MERQLDEEEYWCDPILGSHRKRSILSRLNARHLSKEEMDEIFVED